MHTVLQYFIRCKSFPRRRADIGKCKRWGGLWKVNNNAQNILSITEKTFRHATKDFVFKINEVKLTSEAVQFTILQSYYDNLCQNAESLVDEEISVNLLEQILGLLSG